MSYQPDEIRLIHHETPRARKEYQCHEQCGEPIKPGERYVRQRCTADGDAWTYIAHPQYWVAMLDAHGEAAR